MRIKAHFVLFFCFLISFALLTTAVPTAYADPNFSNVNDILGGRRSLFRDDDLLVTQYPPNEGVTVTILQTLDDAVANQIEYGVSDPSNFVTAAPRMFDLPNDVQLTIVAGAAILNDQASGTHLYLDNNLGGGNVEQGVFAQGDFTGDNFQDVAFIENGNINVVTANNVHSLQDGLFYGTPIPLPSTAQGFLTLAADDFDADGITELALGAWEIGGIAFNIYKPHPTLDANGNITALSFDEVGSTSIPLENPQGVVDLHLTSGVLSGAENPANQQPYRQLVALYQLESVNPVSFQTYLAAITVTPGQGQGDDVSVANTYLWQLALPRIADFESDYLDFFANLEQLVVLSYPSDAVTQLDVLTVDANLNFIPASSIQQGLSAPLGLALGNFDQASADSSPLVLEAAVLTISLDISPCEPLFQAGIAVTFIHFDPNNSFQPSAGNKTQVGTNCYDSLEHPSIPTMSLIAGDTQGRSIYVGTPTVMTVNHTQSHLALGAPPMHVDYVSPGNNAAPTVLNVSAAPKRFYSQYSTDVTNSNQSNHQGTTSFSNGGSVSVSGGYRWGGAISGSVTVKAGASAGYMNTKSIAHQYSTYTGETFDASTNTGYDDQVWLDIQTHYVYVFPVIGHSVCPDAQSTCPASDMVPMVVLFSGPTITETETVTAAAVEWYQPVHQQGSVFTYPWNLTQLRNAEGNVSFLTPSNPTGFSTDDSSTTESVTWQGQGQTSVTAGTANNINWSSYLSISTKPGLEGGAFGSAKVEYNGSKAFSTLNSSITTLGKSTGFSIVKPTTLSENYAYSIFPYIYGDAPVTGTFQTNVLTSTLQTNGLLRSGFTVNPLDVTASPWWGETYTLPDVALAHPSQWNLQSAPYNTLTPNCVNIGTGIAQCAELNPITDDFANNNFLAMKGLMITPADSNGDGPQLSGATAGDQIRLQARVYNNSLADMPPGSQIVVQFYGQPFDETTKQPNGNAVLIDNVTVAGLPGFNSPTGGGVNPNWTLASTTFDTAPYADKYMVFWVLVVLKDGQGNPLPEMPGHGLTGVPPALDSIAEATTWLEPYSNNLGLYQYLFYIAPNTASSTASRQMNPPNLRVDPLTLSTKTALLNQRVTVYGNIHSDHDTDAVAALLYVGDPAKRGKAFEYEGISHIRGGSFYQVQADYYPDRCGTVNLFLKLVPGGETANTKLKVTIKPVPVVKLMLERLKQIGKPDTRADSLMARLRKAQKAFKHDNNAKGLDAITKFRAGVTSQRGKSLPADQADILLAQSKQILKCVKPKP